MNTPGRQQEAMGRLPHDARVPRAFRGRPAKAIEFAFAGPNLRPVEFRVIDPTAGIPVDLRRDEITGRLRPVQPLGISRPKVVGRRRRSFRIVFFSDCRVHDLDMLLERIEGIRPRPDLILYGGDDIGRFRRPGRNYWQRFARLARYGLGAVAGNDDQLHHRQRIRGSHVVDLHQQPLRVGRFVIAGLEGAPHRPSLPRLGALLYTEDQIRAHLDAIDAVSHGKELILVSHAPPWRALDYAHRFGRAHIGSTALRMFLQQRSVHLVLCGHVHRCGGQVKEVGDTHVINSASHDDLDDAARIAVLDVHDGAAPSTTWCDALGVHAVPEIGVQYGKRLQSAGIRTPQDLTAAGDAKIGAALGWRPERTRILAARARALVTGRPALLHPVPLPDRSTRLFLDIETDPRQRVWLIGCYDEATERFTQFLAEKIGREVHALRQFLRYLGERPGYSVLTWAGASFDEPMLAKRLAAHGLETPSLLQQTCDVFQLVRRHTALPVSDLRLKTVATALGYRFRHPDIDGYDAARRYAEVTRNGQTVPKQLLKYNRDDVFALRHVVGFLEGREA